MVFGNTHPQSHQTTPRAPALTACQTMLRDSRKVGARSPLPPKSRVSWAWGTIQTVCPGWAAAAASATNAPTLPMDGETPPCLKKGYVSGAMMSPPCANRRIAPKALLTTMVGCQGSSSEITERSCCTDSGRTRWYSGSSARYQPRRAGWALSARTRCRIIPVSFSESVAIVSSSGRLSLTVG